MTTRPPSGNVPELAGAEESAYLRATEVVDWRDPAVLARARELAAGAAGPVEVARRCFEFVRDGIRHSVDAGDEQVTCAASEVLDAGTGFCFAKAHLLVALLRASGLRAGFCYQRLAYAATGPGEWDSRVVWAAPLPEVVSALRAPGAVADVAAHLPDHPLPPEPGRS